MLRCFNPKADRNDYDQITANGDCIANLGVKTAEGERNAEKIAAVPTLAMGHNTIKAKTQLYEHQKATMDNDSQRFVCELSRRSVFRCLCPYPSFRAWLTMQAFQSFKHAKELSLPLILLLSNAGWHFLQHLSTKALQVYDDAFMQNSYMLLIMIIL